ncbi:MAG: 50S ribosomal protein L10 [Deltaproteobacteria bacterium]|nr:50S ribosomal protein L10 [Deltaproteobacteria bacterium]MBI3296087.1 50S ribosomal protein L10 [Deltaproteobacteria bacterium]
MNRTEKEAFVNQLRDGVGQSQAMALISFAGLDVEKMTAFRLSLKKQKVNVKVLKNTLAERVLDGGEYKGLVPHLQGPTLLAYGTTDPVVAAKAICEWIGKEGFDLKIKAGAALGKAVSIEQFKALSKLPGRNDLFVSFLWGLKSPPTKFLYALSDAPKRLGYALAALRSKKEKEA